MNIAETYSHFNGLEFLKIHRKQLWEEIVRVIDSVGAKPCMINDTEKGDAIGYNPIVMENSFKKFLVDFGYEEGENGTTIKMETKESDSKTPASHCGTSYIKDRIAVQVLFDKGSSETSILFKRHLALYIFDKIDVGISILPMKSLQIQMRSGVPYYEGELYNVIRQGRGVPAVPLVIVGIMP